MSGEVPTVLIFGHSFVKWLHRDLQSNFDSRADESFNLPFQPSVNVSVLNATVLIRLAVVIFVPRSTRRKAASVFQALPTAS